MKINKTISSLALGLGFAVAAQAQDKTIGTAIYITGSTAFRQQVFNALTDLGLTIAQSGSGGNNNFTLSGTVSDITSGSGLGLATNAPGLAGTAVTAYCDFSGSAEGVGALITPGSATYLNTDSGSFNHTGDDLAFTDVAQSSTPFAPTVTGVTLEEAVLHFDATNHGGNPGTGVAVQPFAFFVNGNASTIKNATYQNIQDLYKTGTLPLSFFTGNAPDFATNIIAMGRYNLSGTRIATENVNSIKTTSNLHQYALTADGTTTPGLASTDTASPPAGATAWLSVGNNGYFTGGNVATALHISSVNNLPPAMGYIGFPDADKHLTGTGGEGPIIWNGQNPGALNAWNITGVENGSYCDWSYEHLYVAPGDQSTFFDETFAPGLIAALQYEITHTTPRTACVESEMNVYRNSDGGDVLHF